MIRLNILVVPPNDILRHPIPNRLYHIMKRLAQRHHIYLLSYPRHPLAKSEKLRHVDCVEISFEPISKVKDLGLYYIINMPLIRQVLAKIFSKEQIDVIIHANILPSYIAVKLAIKHDITTVYDYLDHFPQSASAYYTNTFVGKLVHQYVLSLVKSCLDLSKHIVTVSYTFRDLILDIVKREEKVTIIPNGVDSDLFKPMPRDKARREIGLEDYEYVILYYGSLDAWLDFETLFKALKRLKKTLHKLALILIGISHNTIFYYVLRKLIVKYELQKNVMLYPPQPYEKIPLYINASNLIVAPYRRILKNFVTSLKLFETLACAKPVITAYIPEFKLWFRGMPVIYYKYEHELGELIPKALKLYDASKSELIRASEKIRTEFSWNTLANRYEQLIESLCR